jgi:hypothetical protein
MGEERKLHKVLVGKPGRKRPLGRPSRRLEDMFRMDLRETGWGVDWRAAVNAMMNLRILAEWSYLFNNLIRHDKFNAVIVLIFKYSS